MDTFKYGQIICCSSEKSLTSGLPGFGVRAKSANINLNLANDIFLKSSLYYDIPTDMMVTNDILQNNPQLDRIYPHIYVFRSMQLPDGSIKYLIARVMYVGGDYGFFTGLGNANRVGSNYIAHILVFDEVPPMKVVSEVLRQKLFIPVNTECSSANREFLDILIGEPYELPEGQISVDRGGSLSITPVIADVMKALLQAYKNNVGNKDIRNVILKLKQNDVEPLLMALGDMPASLTEQFFFKTNVIGRSSVPLDMRMMIMNEKDTTETLDAYHITVDLRGEVPICHNVEDNYLFDRIQEMALTGNAERINQIAELYMQLCTKSEVNYEQAYRLLVLASTPEMLTLQEVGKLNIEMISASPLNEREKTSVWQKINAIIKDAFAYPCKLSEVKIALEIICRINRIVPDKLQLDIEEAEVLKDLFFATDKYFQKIIEHNPERLDAALLLFSKTGIELPSEDSLFKSLMTSPYVDEWRALMTYYYKDDELIADSMNVAVGCIMESALNNKYELVNALFPVDSNAERWLNLINHNPEYISLVKVDIDNLLIRKIGQFPQQVMDKIFALDKAVLCQLDLKGLSNAYADALLQSPQSIDYNALERIGLNLKDKGIQSEAINKLLILHNGALLSSPVYDDMKLAQVIDVDQEYMLRLYTGWIRNNADKAEIVEFISNFSKSAAITAQLLDLYWKYAKVAKKEKIFLWIVDHVRLHRYSIKDVINKMSASEAKSILEKESGFVKKMMRKLLGVKMFMILSIVTVLCMTSCGNLDGGQTAYHNPFRIEYYGDPKGTSEIQISEYNKNGVLLNIYSRGFTPNGNLLYSTAYNSKGSIDSVLYSYDKNEKLLGIKAANMFVNNIQYNDNNQLCSIEKVIKDEDGSTTNELVSFSYNSDNLLQSISVSKNGGNSTVQTEYIYASGKLRCIREYEGKQMKETNFSSSNGKILSVYTYSYPQKQLRFVRNYKYGDAKQEKESQYAQSIKLTNSKGYNQGRYDNVYKIYTSEALALYTAEVDNKENLKKEFEIKKEIAAIEKPSKSGSFFSNYYSNIKYRIAVNRVKTASPGMWLLVVVFVLTSIGAFFYYKLVENANWFQSFIGVPTSTGMRRLWMFNGGPYINVALYVGILLASFVSAVLVLLAVGGITYGVLWVVKILIVILIWVGWISLILGLIVLFLAKEGMGCLPIILGGVIVYFEDTLRNFGNAIVNWGFNFMNKLNLFDWGVSLFRNFWDVILTAFAMPLFVFILIALSVMALIFFLMGVEGGIMKIYGIRRPCPVCGSKKEKEYWADEMHKHPVKLQPGIYGVFSHIDPATKVKMPTLLIAGKDKLLRKCPQCGSFIHAGDTTSYGTERHIGIVGHRSSGKTYLIYSILNQILEQYGQLARQIDTDNTTNIESNFKRIQIRDKIQTVVRDSYRAIQIIIAPKLRPVPYHLFFYDVAGEKFNQTSTASKTAMDFYRNVNQIIFIIDPSMIDYTFSACSEKMSGWLQEHPSSEKYSIDGTFSTLKSILESVGRHPKDIDFMFVLVKADTGYMEYCGYNIDAKDEVLKTFMQSELGLTNIINAARGAFHKVEYDLISVNTEFKIRMNELTERILHNLNVK